MSLPYTDTIPKHIRMPRTATKRSIAARTEHVANLESALAAETKARKTAERDLRVLRRIRFSLADQPASVCASLKLINHTSPQ